MRAAAFLTFTFLLTAGADVNKVNVTIEQSGTLNGGGKVTLLCRLCSRDVDDTVVKYSWTLKRATEPEVVCSGNSSVKKQADGFQCNQTKHYSSLTIPDVQKIHNGTYICKLFSRIHHSLNQITLHVSDKLDFESGRKNHACSSEREWTPFLVSLTAILSIIYY